MAQSVQLGWQGVSTGRGRWRGQRVCKGPRQGDGAGPSELGSRPVSAGHSVQGPWDAWPRGRYPPRSVLS